MRADTDSTSLLILLDLTAAFDTVDHNILLQRLHSTICLKGIALTWFTSYLTDRTEYVALGQAKSNTHRVTCGIPQGSVLGPTLFNLYMFPLSHAIGKHGISFHCYADDAQLYVKTNPAPSAPLLLSALCTCLEEIEVWMKRNFLQLNRSKTESILVGTPNPTSITFSGQNIPLSASVTNFGVKMDSTHSFEMQINHLCKTSFLHLRNIAKASSSRMQKSLSTPPPKIEYCNALLIGIHAQTLKRLQYMPGS